MIRVAIFEDSPIVRDAYKALLSGVPGFVFTAAFDNCLNLEHDINKSRPDVVIMDIGMPKIDGIEATRILKEKHPSLKILIQTIFEEEDKITAALCAGANGYLLKSASVPQVLEAIKDVYDGGSVMSPLIAGKVIKILQQYATPHIDRKDYKLTQREKDILFLMTEGYGFPKIAETLFISYETVRSHVKNIYQKLHVAGATEAVSKAIKEKII